MLIGTSREIKTEEYRVRPVLETVREFFACGHHVEVE